jgi:predicted phosphodiesterase
LRARAASRIGILGDIHAEDGFLAMALEPFAGGPGDCVLAVGDIVDGPGNVDACCDALQEHDVVAVRGNHERWLLRGEMRHLTDATAATRLSARTRAFLASLPVTRRIATTRGALLLCHGMGDDDMCTVRPGDEGYAIEVNTQLQRLIHSGDVAMVVCGHSHHRLVRRFGSLTVINAGTLLRGHSPCFGTIDLALGVVTFFEQGSSGVLVVAEALPL